MTSIWRIFGLIGSGETASAFSRSKPPCDASFMTWFLSPAKAASGREDHLIAVGLHFIGADFLVLVVAMHAGRDVEGPVMPRAAHDGAAIGDFALAHGSALVHAAIGHGVEFSVGAEHGD